MYRSLLEGIALEQALVSGMIEEQTGVRITEFIAIGGGSVSDLWCQIVADASGKTVRRSGTIEASSLGAAVCAAVGVGWFPGAADAAESMAGEITRETEPMPDHAARYRELMGIYREIYPRLRDSFTKLSRFAAAE
jgi:xylulokinase